MAKSKEHSELEYLRGQLRQLRSQNKHLKKEIGRLQKRDQSVVEVDEDEEIEYTPPPRKDECPKCKHPISIIFLGNIRKIETCDHCGYRRTIKVKASESEDKQ